VQKALLSKIRITFKFSKIFTPGIHYKEVERIKVGKTRERKGNGNEGGKSDLLAENVWLSLSGGLSNLGSLG
jgi:hypothetical protein